MRAFISRCRALGRDMSLEFLDGFTFIYSISEFVHNYEPLISDRKKLRKLRAFVTRAIHYRL